MLYDAFNLAINASIRFTELDDFLARDTTVDKNFCPVKESHDYGMKLLKVAKKVNSIFTMATDAASLAMTPRFVRMVP